MNCINLRIKTANYQKYIYCKLKKKKIEFKECKVCKDRKYKQFKKTRKKSNKLAKLEKSRFSILTDNLDKCYLCQSKKDDLHEIFGGSNRKKSIIWGLVIPICRKCHVQWKIDKEKREEIQEEAQRRFEKKHGHELFMTEFKKNYIKEESKNENECNSKT